MNSTEARTESLRCVDWNSKGLDITPVLAYGGDAIVSVIESTEVHPKTGDEQAVYLVTFKADVCRNTELNGAAFRAGFTSSIVHG